MASAITIKYAQEKRELIIISSLFDNRNIILMSSYIEASMLFNVSLGRIAFADNASLG